MIRCCQRPLLAILTLALVVTSIGFTAWGENRTYAASIVTEEMISQFEQEDEGWSLNLGTEFPGAAGALERVTDDSYAGNFAGRLSGDFTAGGAYVSIEKELNHLDIQQLDFMVKTTDLSAIRIRITDATGQVHQQSLPLSSADEWQAVTITEFAGGMNYGHWSGANDGVYHAPAKEIAFLMERSELNAGKQRGAILLDQIVAKVQLPPLVIEQQKLGNVFTDQDEVAFRLKTSGDLVRWTVHNMWGEQVRHGVQTIASGSGAILTIPQVESGYYRLHLTAELEGSPTASAETVFAVLAPFDLGQVSDSPFGAATHFGQWWEPELIPLIRQAGMKNVRDEMYWGYVEPQKDVYQFPESYDKYMNQLKVHDLDPLIVFSYTNNLYDGGSTPYTDEGRQGFANYGQAILRQYDDQIKWVEVYNEFNIGPGDLGDGPADSKPEYYYKLLEKTYNTVKAEDPNIIVVGPTAAQIPWEWMEELFALGGLRYMDAVSVHPYRYPDTPEGLVAELTRLQNLIRKYNNGQPKPIWMTEMGWPTQLDHRGVTETRQASYVVRSHVGALANGVEKYFWYDFMNDGLQTDNSEDNFGLIRHPKDPLGAYTPKPGYVSYSVMARELTGANYVAQDSYGDDIMSYLFNKNGEALRVMWALEDYIVAVETDQPLEVTDIMGNRETFIPQQGKVYLTLSGEPLYVKGNVNKVTADGTIAVSGEEAFKGEPVELIVALNNTTSGKPLAMTMEVEGKRYELAVSQGQTKNQAITSYGVQGEDSRIVFIYLLDGDSKVGKLRYKVQTGISHQVKVRPLIEMKKDQLEQSLNIQVDNVSKSRELVVEGAEWRIGDQSGVIDWNTLLLPEESRRFTIPLKTLAAESDYPVAVRIKFAGREDYVYEGSFGFNLIIPATEAMAELGQSDPASGGQQATIDLSGAAVKMADYAGSDDLSGRIWLHYDKDYFYLTAQIIDDVHSAEAKAADIWTNDSIQFAMSPGVPGESREWYEYGISDTPAGPQIYRWTAPGGMATGLVENGKLTVKRDEKRKMTIYGLKLPWTELAPVRPVRNEVMSFSLLVNDNDGKGRKGWLEWGSGIGNEKRPNLFRSMQWMYDQAPPATYDAAYNVKAGQIVQGILHAKHAEGAEVNFEIVENGEQGTAAIVDSGTGEFVYTPLATASGEDSFTFRVSNRYEYSKIAKVTVTIDRPDAPGDDASLKSLYLNGESVAGFAPEKLQYTVVLEKGAMLPEITATANDAKATVGIEPAKQVPGTAKVVVTSESAAVVQEYRIAFEYRKAEPVIPRAHNGSYITPAFKAVSGQLTAEHTEGTKLTYEIVANGKLGTVKLSDAATGKFVYTPYDDATGEDRFTFRVHDGHNYSNTAAVVVTIDALPVVEPPFYSEAMDRYQSYSGQLYLPAGIAGEVSLGQQIKLTIPAGATNTSGQLKIVELEGQKLQDLQTQTVNLLSPVFELSQDPAGQFKKKAILSIDFDAGKAGKEQVPTLMRYDDKQKTWVKADGKVDGNSFVAKIDQLGVYAVVALSDEAVELQPASELKDIAGHWGQAWIEKAVQAGIVKGYSDSTFRPDQAVSCQELVAMLVRALQPQAAGSIQSADSVQRFTDQARIGNWAADAVAAAVQAGWITGYSDGSFRPQEGITRVELAAVLARASAGIAADGDGQLSQFRDAEQIPAWAKDYVATVAASGLMEGTGTGLFKPAGIVTRAEAAAIAMRLMEQTAK
ncbi:S-layer homology domain-containing protein [Paenibacillus sp. GCM10027626]|uniref:S-layer homology domain-containing protein n=1 Tax=Paenibacillus sp. GCM10027626 TaxID=3273411 RepID=UPI00362D8CC4